MAVLIKKTYFPAIAGEHHTVMHDGAMVTMNMHITVVLSADHGKRHDHAAQLQKKVCAAIENTELNNGD